MLGVSSMIIGYYGAKRSLLVKRLPEIDLPLDPRRRTSYLVIAVVVGLIAELLQWTGLTGSFGAILLLMSNQLNLAVLILAYEVYGTSARKGAVWIAFYLLLAGQALIGLLSGSLEYALIPIVFLFVTRWHLTQRLPWRIMVTGFALFVLLNSVKGDYRAQVWYGQADLSLTERISLWLDLSGQAANTLTGNDATRGDAAVSQAMSRLDLLHKFIHVQSLTPSLVPYYNGATYSYFLYAWIPRIVWPDKPSVSQANNTTDVDYGFLSREALVTGTNIGIGHLPEAYANFGIFGIIVVMGLEGILFATLAHVLNSPRSDGGRAIYISIMVLFLNGIGASLVVYLGALIQNMLANMVILRFFSTGFKTKGMTDKVIVPLHASSSQTPIGSDHTFN